MPRMLFGEPVTGFVAEALGLKPIGNALVGGGGVNRAASGQEYAFGNAHRPLMREQDFIASAVVADVLVNIHNPLARPGSIERTTSRGGDGGERQQRRMAEKLSAGNGKLVFYVFGCLVEHVASLDSR